MTKNTGWKKLSNFMDGLYLKVMNDETSQIFIEMNTFRNHFSEIFPDKLIFLEYRYLDFFRFYYSMKKNHNEKKLNHIFKKYQKIGFDSIERKIDIYIFYIFNTNKNNNYYKDILCKYIRNDCSLSDIGSKVLEIKKIMRSLN